MTVRRARTALPSAALVAALLLTGCLNQAEEANNNAPQPDPTQPGDVTRTPVPVEEAPPVVEEVPAEKEADVPEAEPQ